MDKWIFVLVLLNVSYFADIIGKQIQTQNSVCDVLLPIFSFTVFKTVNAPVTSNWPTNYCFFLSSDPRLSPVFPGAFCIPVYIPYTLTGRWMLGRGLCKLWLVMDYLLCTASVFNIVLISYDRFLSVTHAVSCYLFFYFKNEMTWLRACEISLFSLPYKCKVLWVCGFAAGRWVSRSLVGGSVASPSQMCPSAKVNHRWPLQAQSHP